ncbi:adenosylcobinamide amidohydrolase [Metabacillus litoralis]|uniref:adenosylcobinamide amidohydrolase n=1 Tax=Metabacillus TaxID=2675233 RepID=UPI000EF5D501|nr:adenosylcobinamide amidohydrolase [Metabacillus litoralis]UHA58984.1 adenosylcobinamide amidohydrolase [Metabacillus litoralis]
MVQPFKNQLHYHSKVWPELSLKRRDDHLIFESTLPLESFSSAVYGGGFQMATHYFNWQVPLRYDSKNPVKQIEEKVNIWGYPKQQTIGLQTAAKIELGSVQEIHGDEFKMVVCVTAGVGNKARAGKKRKTYSAYQYGTINTFIFIDGSLTHSAMINCIITATEAKAAALQDLHIVDEAGEDATGTTTDSVVIAATQDPAYPTHQFAGTATTIGNSIGCLVYDALTEVVTNWREEEKLRC